jgi:hypothetical protein
MKYAIATVAVLLVAFLLTPTAPVPAKVGEPGPLFAAGKEFAIAPDTRPEKSGIRIAVEGRLKWLGF